MFIAGLIARHRNVPPQAIGPHEPGKIKPVRTQVPDFSGRQPENIRRVKSPGHCFHQLEFMPWRPWQTADQPGLRPVPPHPLG